jgi:fructose-1,6-bisphosphatase
MYLGRTTLSKFLIEQLKGANGHSSLAALLVDIAAAVKAIAAITAKGALAEDAGTKSLDPLCNETVLRYCEWGGLLAGMASEEMAEPYAIPAEYERGPYLLLFDPLHSSSALEVNSLLGTMFSVVQHDGGGEPPRVPDYLQAGRRQVAAGYALYGPSTMLVLTVGKGTHGFTLDRETGNFLLTHLNMRVAGERSELSINTGNERFWEPPIKRYVDECRAGKSGLRERDFKIRWIASTVAQVHRVLVRGGVFLYPRDLKQPQRPGRLRLLFEANPLAFLIEQAGGRASTGRGPILDLQPEELHQKVPVILGSSAEIERIERYHREYEDGTDRPYVSPLFRERSLYREEVRP